MNLKINWRYPKNKLEFYFLSMVIFRDLYKNNYTDKGESKFYDYIEPMTSECPLCEYLRLLKPSAIISNCSGLCALYPIYCENSYDFAYFGKWYSSDFESWEKPSQYTYMIYRRLQTEVLKMIDEVKYGNRIYHIEPDVNNL